MAHFVEAVVVVASLCLPGFLPASLVEMDSTSAPSTTGSSVRGKCDLALSHVLEEETQEYEVVQENHASGGNLGRGNSIGPSRVSYKSNLGKRKNRKGWGEIVCPGPTRFATTFIALGSFNEHMHDLQALELELALYEEGAYPINEGSSSHVQGDDGVGGTDLGPFSEEQDAPPGFNIRNDPIEVNDDEEEEEEEEDEDEDDDEDGGGGGGFGVDDDIDFNYVL
ncbi:hypothetical protein FCV25MIE_29724 [Fagus crenata]